jgi:superfamily II DNA or RNA helicase
MLCACEGSLYGQGHSQRWKSGYAWSGHLCYWAAVQGLLDAFQAVCRSSRVLVVCDEYHHAAVQAVWGTSADGAFANARFVLVLTGTPIRSDGERSVWLAYDDAGTIDHPEGGTYTLTYGEAVDLDYCRPVTFHRHEGRFTVDLQGAESVRVTGHQPAELKPQHARIPGLQHALNFYRLACTPQYEKDGKTPLANGYQGTMLEYAGQKLTELRNQMPDAGGLVIAPFIDMANYMLALLEKIEGETPMLVHSQMPNPEGRIKAFRNNNKRWLVSVVMVSEGVDIKRLRVLVYLPNALTELAMRQAVGRVVRTVGPWDHTRAYIVMPAFETFEKFARRIEEEMPGTARIDKEPQSWRCPSCSSECEIGVSECPAWGHQFPKAATRFKKCGSCGALNTLTATSCQSCGASFVSDFSLTLDEALRDGAIVRGMDIDEDDVRSSELAAPVVRRKILASGDQRLVKILSTLPEESWTRLRDILVAK